MSKSIYDAFETSEAAENEGQWFNYGPGPLGEDQRFLLARMARSNKRYTRAVQNFSDRYDRQMQAKTLSEEVAYEAMLDIFCTTVLLDWSGITTRSGEPLPFSVQAAKELMHSLPDLYADLQALAQSREHYRQALNEEDAGN
jgi:hypothetical protein